MKNIIALIVFLFSAGVSQAQTVRGIVVDAKDKHPLAEANIQSAGSIGTTTDMSGRFSFTCNTPMEIRVSYIGYETASVRVTNCADELEIMLVPVSKNLNEVEITATSNPNKALLEQPLSLVQLKETELKRGTGLFLSDAINTNVPGVYMQGRTHSAGQQFNIRGYGNGLRGTNGINSNFDGQGSKVYLNGIPITDAEGITVMDDIDFNSIGNVEVSKGPSGTLYGMAIAGVVSLETQKAEKVKTTIGQSLLAGSYGLLRSTTHVAIGGENSSLLLNYGHHDFDGYMPHTAAEKDFVNMMGDFHLNDRQHLVAYLGYSDSHDERNGELTIEQYNTFDYSGNPSYIKNNAHSDVTTFRAGLGHTYQFSDHVSNTTTLYGSSQNADNSSAGGWTDKSPLSSGLRSTVDTRFDISGDIMLTGITGIELQQTRTLVNGFRMVADSTDLTGYNVIGPIRSIQSTSSATFSVFTQWTLGLPKGINITAGIGYNRMKLSLEDRLWSSTNNHPGNNIPQRYEATYDDMVSPMVAINKRIGSTASVYASYSTGYKAPVSGYFFIPTTGEVNSGLKPEKGTQIEIGTKGNMMDNRLFYTLAVFNAKFADKMTSVAVPNPANTATLYSYIVNGGELNNTGVELLVKYEAMSNHNGFITSLQPFVNMTYSNFEYKDFQFQRIGKNSNNMDSVVVDDYSGHQVAGVPPLVFNVGVDIATRIGLYGNVNFNYRDKMYFTSDEVNQTESYSLVNAKVGYHHTFSHIGLDVYAGANNITGAQYYYMVFLNQLPDAYLAAPNEINFFGGVNLSYQF